MKKNKNTDFDVIYLGEEEIIIEEDKRKKYPFMIFFFKYGRLITMLLATLSILTFVGGVALTLSKMPKIKNPDLNGGTVLEFDGSDNSIDTENGPKSKDSAERLFDYNGKPIQKSYMKVTNIIKVGNDKVIFFSNGAAVIVYGDKSKLPIYVPNGNNVTVDSKAKTIEVKGETINTIKKTTLPDGMNVYEFANDKLMTELGDDYKLYTKNLGNQIDAINVGNDKIVYFDNGAAIVFHNNGNKMPEYTDKMDNVKVNNNTVTIDGDKQTATNKKVMPNGTTVYDFPNGKSVTENKDKDKYKLYDTDAIVYDKNGNVYEEPEYDGIESIGPPNEEKKVGEDLVLYFDNGAAVVIYKDKDKLPEYIPNKNDVNTSTLPLTIEGEKVSTIDKKILPDGTIIYEFDNDKALIERDGTYELVDKYTLRYDEEGNLIDVDNLDTALKEFTVKNNTDENLKYRIVIEETENYNKFNNKQLPADLVLQLISVDNKKQPITKLTANTWPLGSQLEGNTKVTTNTYILYEGQIEARGTDKVKLALWVDYENATNDTQDKWFVGTIKLYSWYENN